MLEYKQNPILSPILMYQGYTNDTRDMGSSLLLTIHGYSQIFILNVTQLSDKETKGNHCTTEEDRNRCGLLLPVTHLDTASAKFFGTKNFAQSSYLL